MENYRHFGCYGNSFNYCLNQILEDLSLDFTCLRCECVTMFKPHQKQLTLSKHHMSLKFRLRSYRLMDHTLVLLKFNLSLIYFMLPDYIRLSPAKGVYKNLFNLDEMMTSTHFALQMKSMVGLFCHSNMQIYTKMIDVMVRDL